MAMVTLKEILKDTRKNGYAVGGFNFSAHEDAQGIVSGAVSKNSPVILMSSMGAVKYVGVHQIVGMVNGMAKAAHVPVCLHLDHATDYDLIKEAVRAGYTSVMVDVSAKDYRTNIKETKEIVTFAHEYGCSVEAELGMLGGHEENIKVEEGDAALTNPEDVPEFVAETGIDALAVAIGTSHGFYKKEPKLDFDRLEKILALTDCPVVLHGGTGVPDDDFRKCIKMGMSKINVGTMIQKQFSDTIRQQVRAYPDDMMDPRKLIGPAKEAIAEIVRGKIDIFGSENKA